MTVDSSDLSSLSYAGPKEGGRERERLGIAGVPRALVALDEVRDMGRWETGMEVREWPCVELVERVRCIP